MCMTKKKVIVPVKVAKITKIPSYAYALVVKGKVAFVYKTQKEARSMRYADEQVVKVELVEVM